LPRYPTPPVFSPSCPALPTRGFRSILPSGETAEDALRSSSVLCRRGYSVCNIPMPGVVLEYIGSEGCILVFVQSIKGIGECYSRRLPCFDEETDEETLDKMNGTRNKDWPKRRCFCTHGFVHTPDSETLIITSHVEVERHSVPLPKLFRRTGVLDHVG
jgi:hypothetical protein